MTPNSERELWLVCLETGALWLHERVGAEVGDRPVTNMMYEPENARMSTTHVLNNGDADGAFGALLELLEKAPAHADAYVGNDNGDNGGRGGNGGDDGGEGDDGDPLGPLRRILAEGFKRLSEHQGELMYRATESINARVGEFASLVAATADQATRQDEHLARELSETIARALDQNADLAGHLANFMGRVVALEAEVARLKAQHDGDERSSLQ
jgi:hypothetical protein